MNPLVYLSIGLVLLVILLSFVCYRRIRRGRVVSSMFYGLQGIAALFLLISMLLVISNLNTYHRLTFEENILELSIREIAKQNYQVRLNYPGTGDRTATSQIYQIAGDEWQIDTRFIKWKGWATLIGMDSFYRLERISGRYADIDQATTSPLTAYRLSDPDSGINLWELKRQLKTNLPFVDAYYGQSVYLPMQDGAHFTLNMSQSGLVVRPANEVAQKVLLEW